MPDMKTSMLEYVKTVLNKVSFDKRLFRKEYKKSHNWLTTGEIHELRAWLRKRFLPDAQQQNSRSIQSS